MTELRKNTFARGGTKKRGYKLAQVPKPKKENIDRTHVGKIKFIRSIIHEVAGLMPYEKRILDMIKIGGSSSEKRIYKYAKKRLGTHKRSMKKREAIKKMYALQRSRAHG